MTAQVKSLRPRANEALGVAETAPRKRLRVRMTVKEGADMTARAAELITTS